MYRTRTQYRTQTYPTLCGTYKPDDFPSKELLENEIQEGDNLYNVQTKQIECYDSGDELRSPSPYPDTPTDSDVFPDQAQHSIPQSHSSDFLGNGTKVSTPGSCLQKSITAAKPDLLVDVQGTRVMSNKGSSSCSSVRRYQNRVEFSKPFEMSDFYKYSEKLRKCRSGSQTSPQPQWTSRWYFEGSNLWNFCDSFDEVYDEIRSFVWFAQHHIQSMYCFFFLNYLCQF